MHNQSAGVHLKMYGRRYRIRYIARHIMSRHQNFPRVKNSIMLSNDKCSIQDPWRSIDFSSIQTLPLPNTEKLKALAQK